MTRHPFLALGVLALTLRVACAALTEFTPIFPAYYYTDARLFHEAAVSALRSKAQGSGPVFEGPRAARVQAAFVYAVYRVTGPRPFAVKLVNAVLGAAGVMLLAWLFSFVFSLRAAIVSGALVAAWPSHVFYTSQNLKESPTNLLAYAGLACALAAGLSADASRARRAALAMCAALAMIGVGFYRPPVLTAVSAALLAALCLAVLHEQGRRLRALVVLGMVIASLMVYSRLSPRGYAYETQLIPAVSAEGLSEYRKVQMGVGRNMARSLGNRELGTMIYPDREFKDWGEILAFLPKGAFTVLFMPLPGLYAMNGKIGRIAASGENLLLLLLSALAVLGIVRGAKSPARLGLLVFFAVMTAGAALLEIDLGSAGRHKLLYLPMLFPFAVEEALRLSRRAGVLTSGAV